MGGGWCSGLVVYVMYKYECAYVSDLRACLSVIRIVARVVIGVQNTAPVSFLLLLV